jgi:hypothetical protein
VQPTRRNPEQHVTGHNAPAVDHLVLLDDAEGETGEVVLARRETARMLCGFTANQTAARQSAAASDATYDRGRDRRLQRLGDIVVEKRHRLGTEREHVVHTHGDEVDAHGAVALHHERNAELGADAVGRGHQQRPPVARGNPTQCSEATDAGDDLRPHRCTRRRFGCRGDPVTRDDVHSRLAIRYRHQRTLVSTGSASHSRATKATRRKQPPAKQQRVWASLRLRQAQVYSAGAPGAHA